MEEPPSDSAQMNGPAPVEKKDEGQLGATIVTGGTVFRLWAPYAEKVWVVLKGQDKAEMKKEGDNNLWSVKVDGVGAGAVYSFEIQPFWNDCFHTEGKVLSRRDPYARQTDFDSNDCVVVDPSYYEWAPFSAPGWSELIIYELHCGTFTGRNDGLDPNNAFKHMISKLDYIKDLGFNCIEMMPVHEFGGQWGYNPRLLCSVHGKFGTSTELRDLVNEAHKKGIAVIFDVVLNHGSAKLNSLWNHDGYGKDKQGGIYFEGGEDTPWGKKFAFHKREVREMIKASARMFIEEYNGDGLRFDSVHNMPWDLLQEITGDMRHRYPNKIKIAEVTPEHPSILHSAGFDCCWIHATYYDTVKIMRDEEREHHIGKMMAMINGHGGFKTSHESCNSILGSHDQNGSKKGGQSDGRVGRYFVDLFGGRNNWHARAKCRMWYGLQAFSRGLPMIFMGTETHQGGWWDANPSQAFDWGLLEDPMAKQMNALVKKANEVRLAHKALTTENEGVNFTHKDGGHRVLGFVRGNILCVVNASDKQWEDKGYGVQTPFAGKTVTHVFNSQAEEFGGWAGSWTSDQPIQVGGDGKVHCTIPKWSCLAFEAS